jgi:hypothetical protein
MIPNVRAGVMNDADHFRAAVARGATKSGGPDRGENSDKDGLKAEWRARYEHFTQEVAYDNAGWVADGHSVVTSSR